MAGWFELGRSEKGQYRFVLKAGNGQVILASQMYKARSSAENGIASVQKNSAIDERYERKVSATGKPYFVLKAANAQVIGTSEMYVNEVGRDNGIKSVKSNGSSVVVKDLTAQAIAAKTAQTAG